MFKCSLERMRDFNKTFIEYLLGLGEAVSVLKRFKRWYIHNCDKK